MGAFKCIWINTQLIRIFKEIVVADRDVIFVYMYTNSESHHLGSLYATLFICVLCGTSLGAFHFITV